MNNYVDHNILTSNNQNYVHTNKQLQIRLLKNVILCNLKKKCNNTPNTVEEYKNKIINNGMEFLKRYVTINQNNICFKIYIIVGQFHVINNFWGSTRTT